MVYHVTATNAGPGDAYDVLFTDILGDGLTAFEYANVTTSNGLQITLPNDDGFDWTIPVFAVGEIYEIDLFVSFDATGMSEGDQVCNEAHAYGPQ